MPQTNGGSLFSAAFARSRSCEAHWSRQLVWLMERDGRLSRSKPPSLIMSCYIVWQHHNSLTLIRSPSDLLIIYSCCRIVCFNPPADRHCWLGREPQPNCCQWVSCAWLVLVCHRRQMRLESLDAALHHRCSLPLFQQPATSHSIPINVMCDVH